MILHKNQEITWCKYKVYKLFTWTLWPFLDKSKSIEYYNLMTFVTLSVMQELLFQTFMLSFLVLTVCFSWDLRLTIVNPLYPSNKRMRLYVILCIIVCILSYTYEYKYIKGSIFDAFILKDTFDLEEYIELN